MKAKSITKFVISREKLLTYVLLGLLFCFLLAMVLFISFSTVEKETLSMKSEAERAFNSIYMALTENGTNTKASSIMDEEGVLGIGIYSSNGHLYRHLGVVPIVFPYDKFNIPQQSGGDSAYGLYSYDSTTGLLHYMRLARLTIDLDAGALTLDDMGNLSPSLDFPEILYVLMDGTSYAKSLSRIRLMTVFSIIALTLIFYAFIRMYIKNREYRERLNKQESLVSLGAAARTLAHEIKNPLSAITIQVALLKKELPTQFRDDLLVVNQEVERLTQLTNKVSDFLKNPVGNPQLIECRKFLESIITLFETRISFTEDSINQAYIEFDPDRARSVFENLIKNAVESCTGRDPKVEIALLEKKRSVVSISILDRGDGLPKGEKKKIFDPFFTTKIHGSGIGLSITRQFLKARGGNIALISREGGGTQAEVLLPMIPEKYAHIMLKISSDNQNKESNE